LPSAPWDREEGKEGKEEKGEGRKERCNTDPILMLAEITT